MDYIYGIHPVLEAIEAGRTIDKIYVKNARSEVAADRKSTRLNSSHRT